LPDYPQPTEIEIELTNYCNAACTACPRDQLTAEKGFMSDDVYYTILTKYAENRKTYVINKLQSKELYPIITFAGMGEPLLHPKIFEYISTASARDFKCVIFTNISLLDADKAQKLVDSGVNHIYVSFWGIQKEEYEWSMGLDYHTSMSNLERLIPLAKNAGIPITIIWVRTEHITSSSTQISNFWKKKGVIIDNENDPWNRGGYLDKSKSLDLPEQPVDFLKDIWCSQLYFTDTICWNGDVVICSCDYYKKENVMGNIMYSEPNLISITKSRILRDTDRKSICCQCLKPDRNYTFGSEPWDALLDATETQRYTYI